MIHDVGAGGLSNALPELVKDAGFGGKFELRQVESADGSMSPLQICEYCRRPSPLPLPFFFMLAVIRLDILLLRLSDTF